MIKEAVAMKLQKKCRDQLRIPGLDFSQNTVAHFSSLVLLKFSHAAKKCRSDKGANFLERTLNNSCCLKPIFKTTLWFFVELY